MDCIINTPPPRRCIDEQFVGAVKKLWLGNANDFQSITFDEEKNIAYLSLTDIDKFILINAKIWTTEFKEVAVKQNGIMMFEQTIEMYLHQTISENSEENEMIEFILQLGHSNGLIAVFQNYQNQIFIGGVWRNETTLDRAAFKLDKDDFVTGKQITDANGDSIVLKTTIPKKRYILKTLEDFFLLQENGFLLLQENGFNIILN